MNECASPDLDIVAPPFLKYAVHRVPGADGQGADTVHILELLIAQLLLLLYEQACIPKDWKLARLMPLYKLGPLLDPNSYRMLAISGTLDRIYANVT